MNIKKFNEKCSKRSLKSLENNIRIWIIANRDLRVKTILTLEHIRDKERYKERKRYRNSSFYTYLGDIFNIRKGTFLKEREAVLKFPDESIRHGSGLVAKVIVKCKNNAKTVLQKIDEGSKKGKEMSRRKIEELITEYTDPSVKRSKPAPITKLREELKSIVLENEALKVENKTTNDLKREVISLKSKLTELSTENAKLKTALEKSTKFKGLYEKYRRMYFNLRNTLGSLLQEETKLPEPT